MATFSPAVEQWRDPVTAYADDRPVDFQLKWLSQESGGNACSFTTYHESGIYQLMPAEYGSSDMQLAGTTEAKLRSACVPGTQQLARPLTPDEITEQVASGNRYVEAARQIIHQKLQAVGTDWSEKTPDFWAMVKLYHSLPSLLNYLPSTTQALGRPPANWIEFTAGVPQTEKNMHWLSVAADAGVYGAGGGSVFRSTGAKFFFAMLGIGAGLLAARWTAKRYLRAP